MADDDHQDTFSAADEAVKQAVEHHNQEKAAKEAEAAQQVDADAEAKRHEENKRQGMI